MKWQRCFNRWGCACRRRRRRLPTSTRGSTSWASASSGNANEGRTKWFVYTWPSKKALASVKAKVRRLTRGGTNQPLAVLLRRLNPVLRGWANYFRHGVSRHLQLPERLQLASGGLLAPAQVSPSQLEVASSALPSGVATDGG